MKKYLVFGLMAVATLLFVGCADASAYTLVSDTSEPYGFWGGVWHGAIMFPDFIGSLIWDDVAVYAVNNNGAWYDFGFVGGFGLMLKLFGAIIRNIFVTLANGK